MSNEKNIHILEHKLAELEIKISNFQKYNIDEKKLNALLMKKLKYETQLEEYQLA